MTTRTRPRALQATIAAVAATTVLAGCSNTATSEPATDTTTDTSAADATTTELPPLGTVMLTGAVSDTGAITTADLAALPQYTEPVVFESGTGVQQHTYVGPSLRELVEQADPITDGDAKNPLLTLAVVGAASDGYEATVAWGEISPDFAATNVLVALTEDGAPLERPRLVVPGDNRGGRYVSDLVELRVVDTR